VSSTRDDVKARIEAIEAGYEYFLAYAAQGLTTDQGSKSGGQLRGFLAEFETALDGLTGSIEALVKETDAQPAAAWVDFLKVIERDAFSARAAVQLVAGQEGVSSQLVDNLNANIHVRALLANLFIVDELTD